MESEIHILKPKNEEDTPINILNREATRNESELQHSLGQQNHNDSCEDFKVVDCTERKEQISSPLGHLSLVQSNLGDSVYYLDRNEVAQIWQMSKSQQVQILKFPEPVLPAAAKNNGHPEKYLSGWPLISPYKLQMLKCERCSREFCSAVNSRRHFRVHREFLIMEKDSMKHRGFLAAYWDKLPLGEAREILSLKNASIENVSGALITSSLASIIRSPGLTLLPQIYLQAGVSLLDIVRGTPSRFPLSSKELFSILDYASEMTFLCGGTALSLQRYIFGRDAERIALEMQNLISCTSFMIERELVKAWIAHKDVEALGCQQLLMEEEEASQRRQAEVREKKRLKKLRQKQKRVESTNIAKSNSEACLNHSEDLTTSSLGSSSSKSLTDYLLETQESLGQEPPSAANAALVECHLFQNEDQHVETETSKQYQHTANGQNHLSHTEAVNDIQSDQDEAEKASIVLADCFNVSSIRAQPEHVDNIRADQDESEKKSILLANALSVSSLQQQLDSLHDNNGDERVGEELRVTHFSSRSEVMIGSISVKIGRGDPTDQNVLLKRKTSEEGLNSNNSGLNFDSGPTVKFLCPLQFGTLVSHGKSKNNQVHTSPTMESCLSSVGSNDNDSGKCDNHPLLVQKTSDLSNPLTLWRQIVTAFLAQRCKEIMAEDHVTLSLRRGHGTSLDGHENTGANCGEAPKEQPNH